MKPMTAGITGAAEGIDNLSWSILGQTYVPKQISVDSFAWHATFGIGTFVPPHIHPLQDEFLYILEGKLDFMLDGANASATVGDLVRLPKGIPHGIFNNSGAIAKSLFWVAPTGRLVELFQAIHDLPQQTPEAVVALAAKYDVDFLPPPA
ncbi:putative RmlC-like cupin family protein [Inquilinus ginsengisoli]|jgi:uncharacterized RmlC-like cupin family protein|uniref:cupin domain-containing protein n=1 Tax=Inquilinus ginsengisoli TaxID=363840 RepID=UPI003D1C26EA